MLNQVRAGLRPWYDWVSAVYCRVSGLKTGYLRFEGSSGRRRSQLSRDGERRGLLENDSGGGREKAAGRRTIERKD